MASVLGVSDDGVQFEMDWEGPSTSIDNSSVPHRSFHREKIHNGFVVESFEMKCRYPNYTMVGLLDNQLRISQEDEAKFHTSDSNGFELHSPTVSDSTEEQMLEQARPFEVTSQSLKDLDEIAEFVSKLKSSTRESRTLIRSDAGILTEVIWRFCFSSGVDGFRDVTGSIYRVRQEWKNCEERVKVRLTNQWFRFRERCESCEFK